MAKLNSIEDFPEEMCRKYSTVGRGLTLKTYYSSRNSEYNQNRTITDFIRFCFDDDRPKNKDYENFKQYCYKRFPYFDEMCSECFFRYMHFLFEHVYGSGLQTPQHRSILADIFMIAFLCYKKMDTVIVQFHDSKGWWLAAYPNEKHIVKCFKEQTDTIVAAITREKPLTYTYCFETFYSDYIVHMAHCMVQRLNKFEGHHHQIWQKKFVDTQKEILTFQSPHKPIDYYK